MRMTSLAALVVGVVAVGPPARAADSPVIGVASERDAAIARIERLAAQASPRESFLELALAAGRVIDPDLDGDDVRRRIVGMAQDVRRPSAGKDSPEAAAAAMRQVVFVDHGFATPAGDAPILTGANVLDLYVLHRLVKTRTAHCEGLATLYLVVGEAAGLPVSICNAPIHTYARVDRDGSHVNVECTAGGALRPDAAMHRLNGAQPAAVGSETYFRPLDKRQFLCLQVNSLAYGLAKQPQGPAPLDMTQMVRLAEVIERLDPDHPESLDTAALIHARAGDDARAARIEQHALDKAAEYGTTPDVMAYFRDALKRYRSGTR